VGFAEVGAAVRSLVAAGVEAPLASSMSHAQLLDLVPSRAAARAIGTNVSAADSSPVPLALLRGSFGEIVAVSLVASFPATVGGTRLVSTDDKFVAVLFHHINRRHQDCTVLRSQL